MAGGTLTADPGYIGMTLRGDITATGGVTSTVSVPALSMINGPVFTADAGSTLNITGDLTAPNTETVTKAGDGTMVFATTKSYVGPTGVTGGKLLLQTPHLNSASLAVTNNAVVEVAVDGTQNNLIRTPAITVSGTARIDLNDNKLITAMPAGTFVGAAYDGVAGLVDSGRGPAGNALWDGSGIVTSDTRAISNGDLVSIGVAKMSEVRTIADTETTTFAGQSVLGSDTIAMVTWGGDANLDGKINIDDYGRIDGNVGQSGSVFGWSKGDFNYDGKINIDDYGIIDGNINRQGAVFATAGGAGSAALEGVAAVPEPASLSLVALGVMGLVRRRRRAQ